MSGKKMRVVWLCNFTNKEIQGILKPYRPIIEYGFWIPEALKVVEGDSRFDIHVISPHYWIKHQTDFKLRGIHYHFFNPFIDKCRHLFHNRLYDVGALTDYRRNTQIISNLVNDIQPDVIHLIGAENAPYAASILTLADLYPVIFSAQGFISFSTATKKKYNLRKSIEIEQKVIKKIKTAFYRSKTESDNIKRFNPDMVFSWYTFSSLEEKVPEGPIDKKYDIVFFARICKDKGIVDLLDSVKRIKSKRPGVSLCVIGSGNIEEFKNYADEIGIHDNVIWAGFQPTRDDVHKLAVQARTAVLPTYYDMFPGLIVESMFLGIPVVSYDIPCNREINDDGEVIKLAPVGDVKLLSQYIIEFLEKPDMANDFITRARRRANQMFVHSDEKLQNALLAGYNKSIEVFNTGRKND